MYINLVKGSVLVMGRNTFREADLLIKEEINSIGKSCHICLCEGDSILAEAYIRTAGDIWVFQGINVSEEHRSKGYGSLVLKKLTEYLDRHNINLYAYVHSSGTLSEKQLEDWYKRYGFVANGKGYPLVRYSRPLSKNV